MSSRQVPTTVSKRVVAIALALVSVLGLAAVASARSGGSTPSTTTAKPTIGSIPNDAAATHRDLSSLPVPDGMVPVADHQGNLVGYVDRSGVDVNTAKFPPLELNGRGTKLRGVPVIDDRGELVGYEVIALGFVDLTEARDPDALEARLKESERTTQKYLDDQPASAPTTN